MEENAKCAHEGGNVAAVARKELESKTGKRVVTPLNANTFLKGQLGNKEKVAEIPDKESGTDNNSPK